MGQAGLFYFNTLLAKEPGNKTPQPKKESHSNHCCQNKISKRNICVVVFLVQLHKDYPRENVLLDHLYEY